MAVATKACKCTSCGDRIGVGDRITIKPKEKEKGKDLLCFRCHPETESAKIKITVSGPVIGTKSQPKKWQRTK